MASEEDDLEALFDAESAHYQGAAQDTEAQSAVMPASADTHTAAVGTRDKMETYYRSVSGMYLNAGNAAVGEAQAEDGADKPMFERLGGIVRLLHDSLRELGYDKSLSEASSQIVDAKDRLEYIATLTEQSANKVLNTLDQGIPAQDALIQQGKDMEQRWALLFAGKTGIEDFKVLAADARAFSATVIAQGEQEKARLLEIMMAQDFQDITGQIIKKVVGVTKNIEHDLAQLLLDNAPAAVKDKHVDLMAGPSAPATALAQDDVDDLLADLGF